MKAVFANGCFWCTEAVFSSLKGVTSVMPVYSQGAEAISMDYDPAIISYDDLLSVFFNTHDPTTLNRQGNDIGPQYRSAIFYINEEQKTKAGALIKELNDTHAYDKPVVTEVSQLKDFSPAEDYHREYYKNHSDQPYCKLVIAPKLDKLEKKFQRLLAH